MRFTVTDRGKAVRAFFIHGDDGRVVGEADLSNPSMQQSMLVSERAVHGLGEWTGPDEETFKAYAEFWRIGTSSPEACAKPEDIHLTTTLEELYEAHFMAAGAASSAQRTGRLLQLGDLSRSGHSDPARTLLRRYKLDGMVAAGSTPPQGPEDERGWRQGERLLQPPRSLKATVEGGRALFLTLGEWQSVDVLRLDQDFSGSCELLRGLLSAGLQASVILMFVNDQFPPPVKYSSLDHPYVPDALYGCSLSYAVELLRPRGLNLRHLSGPYAVFVSSAAAASAGSTTGEGDGVDEFECYRDTRIWGSEDDFPIDFVREWYFGQFESTQLLHRVWGNVSLALGKARVGLTQPPVYLYI